MGSPLLRPLPNRPKVVLLVGVNGTGKTTSAAKLAKRARAGPPHGASGRSDTFRAAAIEQLGVWGERIGVEVVKGQYNGDAAALCYDPTRPRTGEISSSCSATPPAASTRRAISAGNSRKSPHTREARPDAPHEKLLVVDATTGTNALVQAKQFHEAVGLTGIIVTKLDGSGKGGVVVAIQNELGIPPRYIGTGEKLEDLAPSTARRSSSACL